MSPKSKALVISIALGILFYLIDSLLDSLLLYKELSFLEAFITDPPIQEMYARLLGVCMIIIMGMLIPALFPDGGLLRKHKEQDHKLVTDPNLMVNVSNQIKTPLNAIMGFVELLRDPGVSDASRKLYLGHVRTSGKYLVELINNVTDITMIEAGTLYLHNEECQLNKVLAHIYNQYEKQIKEKKKTDLGILLKTSIKNEDFTIITDEKRLRQVIVNLIENAVSLTDEGIIEFGYNYIDQNTLEFFVKDTGTGLSPGRLEMVFKQFMRVTDTQMRPFDIVSLRLNISKHIVNLFGSELNADSQLGQGSDFRFKLKIRTVKNKEKTAEPDKIEAVPESGKGPQWKGKQVLIAEDVESNFIYMQEILKPTGTKILWAENGLEAIKLCRQNKGIDMVLMDILMPEMDGYEAAKIIKKEKPDLPIIAQTAYHLDENEYKGAKNFFDHFMVKPIWSYDLMNVMGRYLTE